MVLPSLLPVIDFPLPLAAGLLAPGLILALCLVAGIGTVLLLPGGRSVAWRRIGAAILAAAALFFFVALFVEGDQRGNVYFWIFTAIALFGSVRVVTHPKPVYSALYFVLTVFASAGLFVLMYAEFMAAALVTIYAGAILVTYTFVIMLAADAAPPTQRPEDAARDFLAEHDQRARFPLGAAAVGFLTMAVLLLVIFDRAPEHLEKRLSLIDPIYLISTPAETPADPMGVDAEAGPEDDGVEVVPVEALESEASADVDVSLVQADAPDVALVIPRRGDLYPYNDQPANANERGGIQVLGIYLFTRQMVALQLAGLILTVAMVGAIVIARKQVIPDLRPAGLARAEDQGETYATPFTPVDDNPKSLPVKGTGNPRQKAYPQN